MKIKREQREPGDRFYRDFFSPARNRLFACLVQATLVPADPVQSGHLYL